MKKFSVILSIAFIAALVSCNKDESADLAWKNGESPNAINEIVWAGDEDNAWEKTDGYAVGVTTESKEVTKMSGDVACSLFDGEEFVPASVEIEGVGDAALTLNDGESYVYTINASAKK